MTTDEEIGQWSSEIDELLFEFVEKHEIGFLDMAAIVLARLSHISREVEQHIDFAKLLLIAEHTVKNVEIPQNDYAGNTSTFH